MEIIKTSEGDKEKLTNQQIVLDEESYLDAIDKIIRRDFFPSLFEQDEDASNFESKDNELFRDINLKYNLHIPNDISLNEFSSKYTSEDNASFCDLMKIEQETHNKKFNLFFNNSKKNQNLLSSEKRALPITWPFSPRNSLLFHPSSSYAMLPPPSRSGLHKMTSHNNTRFEQKIPSERKHNRLPSNRIVPSNPYSLLDTPLVETNITTWGDIVGIPQPLFKMQEDSDRERALYHTRSKKDKRKSKPSYLLTPQIHEDAVRIKDSQPTPIIHKDVLKKKTKDLQPPPLEIIP